MITQLFLAILEVSISTSIVILILKMLSFLINKNYAAKWKKWIWLLVAVRLIIPVNFAPVSAPIQLDVLGSGSINNTTNTSTITTELGKNSEINSVGDREKDTVKQNDRLVEYKTKNLIKPISWLNIVTIVWGAGVIIYVIYHLMGYLYYSRQILRWRRPVKEQRIHNISSNLSKQLFVNRQPKVYVCDKASSPSLIGFIHPFLVIPSDSFSDVELTFILKHELTHHRHKDNSYKLFLLFVNAIHWFNPVIYLLRQEADVDLELACDEEVIKGMSSKDRIKYGETILSCIKWQKIRKNALTTGFNQSSKSLKVRLKNILSKGKKRSGLLLIIIILLLNVSAGGMVSLKGGSHKQKVLEAHTWYGDVSLISENIELPNNLIENEKEWNEFLVSDKTIALVASIPQEDIYVYGLKETGTEKGTYTLRGICVKQGDEIQVLDSEWGVYGELPKIRYQDYDSDGIKEIAMIVRSSSGTNLSINDLHILTKNKEGGWGDHLFDSHDWSKIINGRIEYLVKNNILTMTIDGKDTGYRIDTASLEEEWGEKLTSIFFGSYGEFIFDKGTIYLKLLPTAGVGDWATPQTITDTYIQLKVAYSNGKFELVNDLTSGLWE